MAQRVDNFPSHLNKVLSVGRNKLAVQFPLFLPLAIVIMMVVVLAGPSWERADSPFGEDKASVLVILDNSYSMLADDIAPSRLERAKQKVADLLEFRSGGSTGLIVFAGSSHIAMPMTQDSSVFTPILAAISPDIMPHRGKSAELVLELLDEQLNNRPGATVVLITDGLPPVAAEAFEAFATSSVDLR